MNDRGSSGESYLPAIMVLVALVAVVGSLMALTSNPPGPAGPPVADLRIDSVPSGAIVHLDGRNLGRTPITASAVESGEHFVKLELGGYRTYAARRTLDLAAPEPALSVPLVAEPKGEIRVTSVPEGARVYVSGEFRGHTPILLPDIAPGTYTVLVSKTNCEPWTASVNVGPEGAVELKAELEDKVLRFMLAAIEAEPTNVDHYTDLGHYYFIRNMLDESVAAYAKGLELGYMKDVATGSISRLDNEIKKHTRWPSRITPEFRERIEAERLRLAKRFPENVVQARLSARSFLAQGRPDRAIEVLTAALDHAPENVELIYEVGRAHLAAKDCNRAMAKFEEALQKGPGDLYLRRRIATECTQKRSIFTADDDRRALSKLAKKVLGEIVERSVDRYAKANAHYDMGRLYAEEELLEHAAKHMSDAVTLGTGGVTLMQWQLDLGGIYARLGRTNDARVLYQRVLNFEIEGSDALQRTARKALDQLDGQRQPE